MMMMMMMMMIIIMMMYCYQDNIDKVQLAEPVDTEVMEHLSWANKTNLPEKNFLIRFKLNIENALLLKWR